MFNIKQRIKYAFKRQVIVLMYHRVASPDIDPWQLALSPQHFEQQLQWLQKENIVEPLPKIIKDLEENKLSKRSIAITFDDGYADNYHSARPLLEKYGIPATFFITSRNIDSLHEFWWDELAKIVLETKELPPALSLDIDGELFQYGLEEETSLTTLMYQKHKDYISWQPNTRRAGLYYKLWERLTPMAAQGQQQLMEKIRDWAAVSDEPRPAYLCLTSGQIKELATGGLFNIGGHTVSHPALSFYNKDVQQHEILANKLFLEQITGITIDLFAYPSGKYNDSTIEILRELDFKAAFTTQARTVKNYAEPFTMGRFQVNNWTGEQLKKMLLKWS